MDVALLIEAMRENFVRKGYQMVEIHTPTFGTIPVSYRSTSFGIKAFAILDEMSGHRWSEDECTQLFRYIQTIFTDRGAQEVLVCHVFCTDQLNSHRKGTSEWNPYWTVDVIGRRLIMYEDQPDAILDGCEIMEATLQGQKVSIKRGTIPFVTIGLFLLNVGLFLYMRIRGCSFTASEMIEYGAMYPVSIQDGGEFYRWFTYMFLHFDLEHLMNNMISLCILGYYLELAIGRIPFLLVYLCGGFGAGIISYLSHIWSAEQYAVSAGASGAIFAIMGGLLADTIINKKLGREISPLRILLFVGLGLYSGFASKGVDNAAHLGGLLCGFLIMIIIELILTKKGRELN